MMMWAKSFEEMVCRIGDLCIDSVKSRDSIYKTNK